MSKDPGIIRPRNCDSSVRQAIQQLATKVIGLESTVSFAGLTLTGLSASRLLSTNSSKVLTSVSDLASWIAGTGNQVIVANDGDGSITLSTPQDTDITAKPRFEGLNIKDSDGNIILYCDENEFYVTELGITVIVAGNPIGLLLSLTYAG